MLVARAGHGGNGCTSFWKKMGKGRRTKGPDGCARWPSRWLTLSVGIAVHVFFFGVVVATPLSVAVPPLCSQMGICCA